MHLVEHLLLRPKLDEVLDEEGQAIQINFLDVCLNKCDIGLGLDKGTETIVFKKKVTRIPAAICYDQMPWILEYFQYQEDDPTQKKIP